MFFVTSGFLTVPSLQLHDLLSVKQLKSPEQRVFFLPMEITNRVFNSQLLNSASEEYKIMYKEVTDLLDSIYDCSNINTPDSAPFIIEEDTPKKNKTGFYAVNP
ncbi:unnamed protein product [Pleuronectes platessa]|uniref:SEA domain-containing protein n=1 Tax=Pleuronectes platessa TaxID=8262 RepID=A0A9N7UH79_PLEPL|nr:unnamed protein product [Pleuronectes platessa]